MAGPATRHNQQKHHQWRNQRRRGWSQHNKQLVNEHKNITKLLVNKQLGATVENCVQMQYFCTLQPQGGSGDPKRFSLIEDFGRIQERGGGATPTIRRRRSPDPVFMMVSPQILLLLPHLSHFLKRAKNFFGMHPECDPDQTKKLNITATSPLSINTSPLSRGFLRAPLLATLAFGHLREPIWLLPLIVDLPDLATPIAKSASFETVFTPTGSNN